LLHAAFSFVEQLRLRSAFDQQLDLVRSQLLAAQTENTELKNKSLANESSISSLQDALNKALQRYKEEQML
jgi:hypothetical protein